uniref:Ribonuclease P protein subunit p29 n=1 Tax=Meloidogyne javanica TaxID=6303 RepID=A0A915MGN4_MELJA
MSNNSSNGSENSEGYIREEPKENLEDVNYNGCASGDETIEDQVEHSRLQDGQQPNSQSVSDDEEDMVKLDNNDLNYDDYDDYEGEARERVESNNSSVHLQHSEELKESEMVGVSDSEGEEADDVQKVSSLNAAQPIELPLPIVEPIQTYKPREKEVCRFYLRGICKNGEACRFKHCTQSIVQRPRIQIVSTSSSSTLITGGGKVPIYYNNKLSNLTSIPPPIGPPVSFKDTESVAWMEGLKKARELARRQKGGEILPMESNQTIDDNDDQSSLSPPLACLSPNPSQTDDSYYVSSSDLNKPMNFMQNRRTIPARVVVEAVSVVSRSKDLPSITSTRSQAKSNIPSLIDSMIEHSTTGSTSSSKLQKGQQRQVLITGSNSSYSDPWARSSSNSVVKRSDGKIMKSRTEMVVNVAERPSRRRRRSSSSNSSSDHSSQRHSSYKRSSRRSDEDKHHKEVERERENKLKRHSSEQHSDSFNDITSPDVKKSKKAYSSSRRDASVGSSVSSASFKDYDNREIQSSVINTTKRNSRSSSNESSDTFASLSRESHATLGALLTHKSSATYSPKNRFKGPRTPPMNERPESKNSSSGYDDYGNRKISVESGHSFGSNERNARRHSQTLTKSIKKEEVIENDQAPAAYRLSQRKDSNSSRKKVSNSSAKINKKSSDGGRKTRSSSSSSSSSSSDSSSSSSSSSASEEKLAKSSKKHHQQQHKPSLTASSVSSLKNKGGNIEVHHHSLDKLVREISSAESDNDDNKKVYSNNYSNKKKIKREVKEETFDINELQQQQHHTSSYKEICNNNSIEVKTEAKYVDEVTKGDKMQQASSSSSSTKRREQLLRKLQNVEQAIARQKMENSLGTYGDARIKIFNFEKQKRKERPVRQKAPENLIRRAGGLKRCTDLKGAPLTDRSLTMTGVLNIRGELPHPVTNQIGLYGIVLHESKSTFQMITKRDRVIVIPKEDTTFQFVVANKVFTLFGSALKQRSHLRGKKSKMPKTIPYLLD